MNNSILAPATTVPFHFLGPKAKILLAPAMINGQGPFDVIVDTGNGSFPVLISEALAEQLGISSAGAEQKTGFAVELDQALRLGQLDSFSIGDISVSPIDMAVAPALDQLSSFYDRQVAGNIGYPFLKDYAVTLDLTQSTLTLSAQSEDIGGARFEIGPEKPLVLVEVLANGRPFSFVFDTGASGTCISYEAASLLNLELGRPMAVNRSEKPNSHESALSSLQVDNQTQTDVRVVVAEFVAELSKLMEIQIDGVLGFNFWGNYLVTIDFPRQRLRLAGYS